MYVYHDFNQAIALFHIQPNLPHISTIDPYIRVTMSNEQMHVCLFK